MSGGDSPERLVYGIHPVHELLEKRPGSVERLFATRERRAGLGRLLRVARLAGVPVTYLTRELLLRKVGRKAVHQGVAAQVSPVTYHEVEALVSDALEQPHGALVMLDGVVDPQNVGAALRTCAAVGVCGVILASGAAGLGPGVAKASAGAVERVRVGRESKPGPRLLELRRRGFRVIGLDGRGDVAWDRADLTGRIVVVAGSEQKGLRNSVREAADQLLAIPLQQGIESLNVAVALGVLLFEAVRQRRLEGSGP